MSRKKVSLGQNLPTETPTHTEQPSTHVDTLTHMTDTRVWLRTAVRHGGMEPRGAEDAATNTRGHARARKHAGARVPRGCQAHGWVRAEERASQTTSINTHGQMCRATAVHRPAARADTRSLRGTQARAHPAWVDTHIRTHTHPACTNAQHTPPKASTPRSTHASHTHGCPPPNPPTPPSTHPQKGPNISRFCKKKKKKSIYFSA